MKKKTEMHELLIKRAYDKPSPQDGYRILVDRIWPRGIKKELLDDDLWAKYIAPTSALRKQFGHIASRFDKFKTDYQHELDQNPQRDEFLNVVKTQLKKQNVTFVFSAKSETLNQAIVLKDYVLTKIED